MRLQLISARPITEPASLTREAVLTAQHPLKGLSLTTRSMLLTTYGAFIRDLGGWAAVRDLVTLFEDLDVDSGALRAALTRLKGRGTVVAEKVGGSPGYRLSPGAEALVAEGEQRLLGHLRPTRIEDGWVLAIFSVPEDQREQRILLTSRLEWLGYGQMAAGVRIAPAAHLADTVVTLERLGLAPYVHLLRAHYDAFQDLAQLVKIWWDLDTIAAGYTAFVEGAQPTLKKWDARARVDSREAFVDYIIVRTLWRRLPYLDPGLPDELYPGQWPRSRATGLFMNLDRLLRKPALDYVRAVTGLDVRPPQP